MLCVVHEGVRDGLFISPVETYHLLFLFDYDSVKILISVY